MCVYVSVTSCESSLGSSAAAVATAEASSTLGTVSALNVSQSTSPGHEIFPNTYIHQRPQHIKQCKQTQTQTHRHTHAHHTTLSILANKVESVVEGVVAGGRLAHQPLHGVDFLDNLPVSTQCQLLCNNKVSYVQGERAKTR